MKEFLSKINNEKIRIRFNEKPIKMSLFLSFLTVKTKRCHDHLGANNGWTKLVGDNGLIVSGGVVRGVEYLDDLQFGKNLDNPYNNYVNPFYLFDILTTEGKVFFLEYYKDDIRSSLLNAREKATAARIHQEQLFNFWENMGIEI